MIRKLALLIAAAAFALASIPAAAQVGKKIVTAEDAKAGGKEESLFYPNLAKKEDMVKLPGMTEAIADEVIKGRPYKTMLDLDKALAAHLDAEQRKALYLKFFEPLNLNTATEEEIKLVPGVGPKMTHEFLEYRPYVSLAEFHKEIGKYVDKEELARLAQYVFVPVDLNEGTDEAILSIPGVGNKMLHEFKEYRPYENIEKFRKEIGKYVDEKEVARLERYVTIKKKEAEAQPAPQP